MRRLFLLVLMMGTTTAISEEAEQERVTEEESLNVKCDHSIEDTHVWNVTGQSCGETPQDAMGVILFYFHHEDGEPDWNYRKRKHSSKFTIRRGQEIPVNQFRIFTEIGVTIHVDFSKKPTIPEIKRCTKALSCGIAKIADYGGMKLAKPQESHDRKSLIYRLVIDEYAD